MLDEDDEDFDLEEALKKLTRLFFWCYIDFMVNEDKPNFHRCKDIYLKFVNNTLDVIDDVYADHVEGIRKEIMEEG